MNENEWTNCIKEVLQNSDLGNNVFVDTLNKIPYAKEILSYDLNFNKLEEHVMTYETDLLIYEKGNIIKPRVIIESKINSITTHDAITYSYKALSHKNVTPFLRYGIMIGNRKHHPLPGRLFRHGTNFDFMISFKDYNLTDEEKISFIKLLKKEILYSRNIEEMIYESRSKNRKHYYILQKKLYLKELE